MPLLMPHWLDTAPIDWTQNPPREVRALLAQHYPTESDSVRLLQEVGAVGIHHSGSSPVTNWHHTLNRLACCAKLRAFVINVAAEISDLKQFCGSQ